jgi:hypothetical protein
MGVRNDQEASERLEKDRERNDEASVSSDEYSSSHGSSTNQLTEASSTADNITHKEDEALNRSKYLVYLVLLLAAVAVGLTTYFFTSNTEQDDFKNQVRHLWFRLFWSR